MQHKNRRNLSADLRWAILRFDSAYSKKLTWLPKIVEVCGFLKSPIASVGFTTGNSSSDVGCSS